MVQTSINNTNSFNTITCNIQTVINFWNHATTNCFILYQLINFVSIDQPANVLLSAYDAQTYGKLIGNVTKIGANTQTKDDGSSFYPIQIVVRDKSFDLKKDTQAEFIPGMEATVELIGEKRTIAAYLMKPMDKMRGEAFRERQDIRTLIFSGSICQFVEQRIGRH